MYIHVALFSFCLLLFLIPLFICVFAPYHNEIESFISVFSLVVLCFGILLTIVDAFLVMRVSYSSFHSTFISLTGVLGLLFSEDGTSVYSLFGIQMETLPSAIPICLAFAATFFVCAVSSSMRYFFTESDFPIWPLYLASLICSSLYAGLHFLSLAYIAWIIYVPVVFTYTLIIYKKTDITYGDSFTYYVHYIILYAGFSFMSLSNLKYEGLISSSEGWSVGYYVLIILCFIAIYAFTVANNERIAMKATLESSELRTRLLNEQIKPHFIFNSLTSVKSNYRHSLEDGDKALSLFSNYLRSSLDLLKNDLVDFEEELTNISNYLDFVNFQHPSPFNLVYDVDSTNFKVPSLCLQPLVENAIKYSGVNENGSGHIVVSSHETPKGHRIAVIDDGVGFDASKVKNHHGIDNVRQRLSLLCHSELHIESEPGKGTTIWFLIKGEENEHHRG